MAIDHLTGESSDIERYNARVQQQAAREYNDRIIQSIAPDFRADRLHGEH